MKKTFLRRGFSVFLALSFLVSQSGWAGLAQAVTVGDNITSPSDGSITNLDSIQVCATVSGIFSCDSENLPNEGINTIWRGTAHVTVTKDTQKPVITVLGDDPDEVPLNSTYDDAGATALDNGSVDMTDEIDTTGTVNTAIAGTYTITYSLTDWAGNDADPKTRTVNVIEQGPTDTDDDQIIDDEDNCPFLANPDQRDTDSDSEGDVCDSDDDNDLVDDEIDNCQLIENTGQEDMDGDGTGDDCDEDVDGDSIVNETDNCIWDSNPGQANWNDDGEGDVCDNSDGDEILDIDDNCINVPNNDQKDENENGIGDACEGEEDIVPPFITILGLNPVTVFLGDTYSDAGAEATDDRDGDITENIEMHSNVNTAQIGSYLVTYDVSDAAGNEADQKSRTVNVVQRSSGGGSVVLPRFTPKNVSIIINTGNDKTANRDVAISIVADDAAMMAISNSSSFSGSIWENFSKDKEWTLTDGNGLKTVYAKFKNNKGTESAVYTDTITLDSKSASDGNGQVLGDSTVSIYDGDLIRCVGCEDPGALYVVKIAGNQKFIRHIKSDFFRYYKDYSWNDVKEVPTLEGFTQSRWIRVNTGIKGAAKPTDKVYEVNGDWTKHWLNMTKEQFYARGGSETAVFSVNIGELSSYPAGPDVAAK